MDTMKMLEELCRAYFVEVEFVHTGGYRLTLRGPRRSPRWDEWAGSYTGLDLGTLVARAHAGEPPDVRLDPHPEDPVVTQFINRDHHRRGGSV